MFGIFMNNKKKDFSNIRAAFKNVRIYIYIIHLALACLIFFCIYIATDRLEYFSIRKVIHTDEVRGSIFLLLISFFYQWLFQNLFYKTLANHSTWVSRNGIFFNSNKKKPEDMSIIKGGRLKQYSVADELIKWAQLKENGHITEDEYNKARAKLLKNN